MIRAYALLSVDQAFISQVESYQKTLEMFFTASLLGTKHKKDGVENKPASLHVVPLAKTLNQIPRSLCGKQVAEPSSLRVVAAQSKRKLAKKANEKLMIRDTSPKMKALSHTKKKKKFSNDLRKHWSRDANHKIKT